MATVFETRLIGNVGKDAVVNQMDKGIVAINFPVAHNKNWKDKRTGEQRTKTTWVSCTIWKREGSNMRILDFLTKGTLVEVVGTPFAKAYVVEDNSVKAEIRLNVSKTNILRPANSNESFGLLEGKPSESQNIYEGISDSNDDDDDEFDY